MRAMAMAATVAESKIDTHQRTGRAHRRRVNHHGCGLHVVNGRRLRVINRSRLDIHRSRRCVNHLRGRRRWCWQRNDIRRLNGDIHGLMTCRRGFKRAGDDVGGGDAGQNFPDRRPLTVSRRGALHAGGGYCGQGQCGQYFFHSVPLFQGRAAFDPERLSFIQRGTITGHISQLPESTRGFALIGGSKDQPGRVKKKCPAIHRRAVVSMRRSDAQRLCFRHAFPSGGAYAALSNAGVWTLALALRTGRLRSLRRVPPACEYCVESRPKKPATALRVRTTS